MLSFAIAICSTTFLAATAMSPPVDLKFEKYSLPNGLQVILHEDHSTPIVGTNVWYHVGSKDERPGRTGFAHLFEHMMFQGSQHFDQGYIGPLQRVGGRLNGSTAMDRTNYWETVPANYLALALWMESDRMGFLLPALTQQKLDNQRDVVKNERRQSYENRPYGLVHEVILAAMYPNDFPYSWPTIGSMKDISAASRADVADFFRRYYHPANASLCIAGDFDPREARRLVAQYFGPLPAGPKVVHPRPATPLLEGERLVRMTDRVGLARVYMVWPTPQQFTRADAELDILAHVLAGGKTSRLYRRLVRRDQIAQDVQAYQNGEELTGEFAVVATARPGHHLAEIEAALAEEIARIRAQPPTEEEVARAVNSFQSQTIRSLESVSEFGGRADRLNMYNVMTGDPGYLAKDFAEHAAVDPAAVQQAAAKYLGPGRVVVEVTPGAQVTITPNLVATADTAREELAAELPPLPALPPAPEIDDAGRGPLPQAAAEPKFSPPPIRRARLSTGTQVLLVEKHQLPTVHLHLVFLAGRAQDPVPLPGLAELTAAVWDEGTKTRSAEDLAVQLADLGASLSVATDWDTTTLRLFTLRQHLAAALDIYADVLRNPAFPSPELDRQRRITLGRLDQIRNEPLVLAPMAVDQLLYGPQHPYGHPQWGSPAVLGKITAQDLKAFCRADMRPAEAALLAVGDVTLPELTAELERVLAGWAAEKGIAAEEGPTPISATFPPLPPPKPTRLVLIDKPGAAQSVIQVALVGAARKSPDFFPLTVMNAVFGGQFSSRLNLNLREKKGYTYGARSAWEWRVRQPGPFMAGASVQTGVTALALAEVLKEFEGMVGGRPVGAKELDFCRKFLTRGYTAGFETPGQVAQQLETLFAFQLPDDYFSTVVPGVMAVIADDVMRVAKEYLPLDHLTVVVVGDRKTIEPGLHELPLGKDLEVLRFDENFRLAPLKRDE
jgi:zinc protease